MNADARDLNALQDVDKETKIKDESENDVWLEMIIKQRQFLAEREERQEEELERMAESIGTSIISVLKATNNHEDSSVYINTNELKNRIKKRRQ